MYWEEEEEEWHLRDALRVEGKVRPTLRSLTREGVPSVQPRCLGDVVMMCVSMCFSFSFADVSSVVFRGLQKCK